ncbi:MAG: hypothetical protein WKF54_07795 [Nocardioidaceae bacterium]
MPRRVDLPGADELFRTTKDAASRATSADADRDGDRIRPSGRIRHDEKITIYVTADELMALEHTRLALRGGHGVAVDRGRIVREAIHLALEDVAEHGSESALVRRLRDQ